MASPRIFIVEDDALVVAHLQQILQEFNYQVVGLAASGAEAISQVDKLQPDLIIMDIRIRGPLNGLDTARKISEKHNIPIIFLTAYANKEYIQQAQVDNAFSYLLKPIRSIDLHTNIQMALFKHRTQKRLNIVNAVLKTRQKLNRFVLQKTNKKDLLEGFCHLLADMEIFSASILGLNIESAQPDIYFSPPNAEEVLLIRDMLIRKAIPICIKKAMESETVVLFSNTHQECAVCPLNRELKEHEHLTYRIRYRDHVYGVLMTFLAPNFTRDEEVIELFREIGDDLAYALHKFDLEELQIKAQKSLEESEYKYRILSENSLVGVFLVVNDRFKYVNPQMAKIFKYPSPEDILRLPSFLDLCHPENHEKVRNIFQNILKQDNAKQVHVELTGKDRNGNNLELEILASRIEYQGASAILGSILDVTEKKEKDEIIRLLSTGINESPVSIIITDRSGKIEYVNPAFTKMSGYSAEEVIGKTPKILHSGEMSEEFYKVLWQTIQQGEVWTDEIIDRKKDGSLYWVKMLISPIKDKNNNITHFLGIQEDISENKRLERQLLQSQKMEAIGRLAGGVAHDFNNLLTVINGYAQLLLYALNEDDPNRKKIEQIYQAGEKAKNLTSQLLAFSRKQMRQVQILNLNDVIQAYYPMLKSLIGENITIEMQLAANLWPIEADKHQLEQILLNLVVNAKQAMPEGGKLSIITGNVVLDDQFVQENDGARTGEFVRFSIADTGVGMDEETLKHIFEPFFTTRGVGEGTGLGLSTVYGIVKQNEGLIYVTSAPFSGTIFDIYFPRVKNAQVEPQNEPQEAQQTFMGNASILLVEDDMDVRKLTSRALTYFGFKVTTARDGKEALEKLKQSNVNYDLLITDLVMPNLSGQRLAQMVHAIYPDLPVLFISGYSENEFGAEQTETEMSNFLQKPFSPLDLAKKVQSILNKETV